MTRRNLSRLVYRVFAVGVICLLLAGCLGEKIALPPVTVTVPIAQGIAFGPDERLAPGQALPMHLLVDGLTCNLPSDDIILDEVRKQAGGTLSKERA